MTSNGDSKQEYLYMLMSLLLMYDSDRVLKLIRAAAKKQAISETLLKGYRPDKITNSQLKTRLDKLYQSPSHSKLAYDIINIEFSNYFIVPLTVIFTSTYFSTFGLPPEVRIVNSIAASLAQSEWPFEMLSCTLRLFPQLFDIPNLHHHYHFLDSYEQPEQNSFSQQIINNPLKAWRNNFPFEPFKVFTGSSDVDVSSLSKMWLSLIPFINVRETDKIVHILLDIAQDHRIGSEDRITAAANLVLLGIDESDQDATLQSLAILDTFRDKVVSSSFLVRLHTTLALGHAFCNDVTKGIHHVLRLYSKIPFDTDLWGFLGSLLMLHGLETEATAAFIQCSKSMRSPAKWPLQVASAIHPEVQKILEPNIQQDGLFSRASADEIVAIVFSRFPEWSQERHVIDSVSGQLHPTLIPEIMEKQLHSPDPLVDEPPLNKKIDKESYCGELWKLIDFLAQIQQSEDEMESAQLSRNWGQVANIASGLQLIWEEVSQEIQDVLSKLALNLSPYLIDSGKNTPGLLVKIIDELDASLKQKSVLAKQEFEKKKESFRLKLISLDLEAFWPQAITSDQELNNLQATLSPTIFRMDTIRKIETSTISHAQFELLFADNDALSQIADQVIDRLLTNKNTLNKSIVHILQRHTFTFTLADRLLTLMESLVEAPGVLAPSFVADILFPIIVKVAQTLGCDPLSFVLQNRAFRESFYSLIASLHHSGRPCTIIDQILQWSSSDLVNRLLNFAPHRPEKDILEECLITILAYDSMPTRKKIKVLSSWLDLEYAHSALLEESDKLIGLRYLRDLLIEDGRHSEATLLVSSVWRTTGNPVILDGFEEGFYLVLIDLVGQGDEHKAFIRELLSQPEHLLRSEYGVIEFLQVCNVGNFGDLVEEAQFQFYREFNQAKSKFPALMDYYLTQRFLETSTATDDEIFLSEISRGMQLLDSFDHDIFKPSCYKSWGPASEYQAVFNNTLSILKSRVNKPSTNMDFMIIELSNIHPEQWILDADKALNNRARHPAYELMIKYIARQIERLIDICQIKVKFRISDFKSPNVSRQRPLRDRLWSERTKLVKVPYHVKEIYSSIEDRIA